MPEHKKAKEGTRTGREAIEAREMKEAKEVIEAIEVIEVIDMNATTAIADPETAITHPTSPAKRSPTAMSLSSQLLSTIISSPSHHSKPPAFRTSRNSS